MSAILIIASRSDIAGGENYLLSCLKHMDRGRYHPIVWLPGDGTFREALERAGVEHVIEPVDYGWLKPPTPWYEFLSGLSQRVRRVADLIRDRNIRLVHTNSNMILEGALAARIVGVPHLYLAHIEFQPNLPFYERLPFDAASFARLMGDLSAGIIAVSGRVRDALCPPLPVERVRVVNNGLDTARYDAALASQDDGLRRSLGLDQDSTVVVAAGRITQDKGFDVLIEAARTVCRQDPRAVFLICGQMDSAEYHGALMRQIALSDLKERVLLPGRRDDLPNVLAQSDVFVLPSRREGHPYVLLEAMACNLPVVATRCGGVDETVIEGETGYIVPIGNPELLAERLLPLLANPELRERMGRAAGRRVRKNFTAAQTAQRLFETYEELLAQPAPVAGSYAIDLLLQVATECGSLGLQLTDLEERMKRAERAAALVLDNPLMQLLRRFRKH